MTKSDTKILVNFDGIGRQLKDRMLTVPIYQRSYAWTEDHVTDLIDDLKEAIDQTPSEYFLGTLVLCSEDEDSDEVTIIDGQQRLATSSILLAAIRDFLKIHGETERSDSIQNTYLGSYDIDENEHLPRLTLNSFDDDYFAKAIVAGKNEVETPLESHLKIAQAYDKLYEFVEAEAEAAGEDWVARLLKWVKFLRNRVRVVHVTVPSETDAFMIFETLNDRGADLTLVDLLKNFLFGRAGSKLGVVRDNWLLTLGAFDSSDEVMVKFIRHYWSSKYGAVRERELFKKIRDEITTQAQSVAFAAELKKNAKLYAALLGSDSDYWNSYGPSARDSIDTLATLALEQNRPMLLAMLEHFSKAEAKKALRASVSWGVRGLVVGGIGGGKTERAYCQAAMKIRKKEITTTAELLTELGAVVPSDSDFKVDFARARVTRPALARYYLNALERQKAGETQPELVPNANEDEVNLEHVLPRNAKPSQWPGFTSEQRRSHVHRLGNHALMKKDENGRIGNEPFSTKRPILAASSLDLTSMIGAETTWGMQEIESRQGVLAALVVQAWPR